MNMKSTLSKNPTIEDVNKKIGSTIVQTMSKDPLMQRVGIITGAKPWEYNSGSTTYLMKTYMLEIYWQPCKSMPLGRPYPSSHVIDHLGEYYFVT